MPAWTQSPTATPSRQDPPTTIDSALPSAVAFFEDSSAENNSVLAAATAAATRRWCPMVGCGIDCDHTFVASSRTLSPPQCTRIGWLEESLWPTAAVAAASASGRTTDPPWRRNRRTSLNKSASDMPVTGECRAPPTKHSRTSSASSSTSVSSTTRRRTAASLPEGVRLIGNNEEA